MVRQIADSNYPGAGRFMGVLINGVVAFPLSWAAWGVPWLIKRGRRGRTFRCRLRLQPARSWDLQYFRLQLDGIIIALPLGEEGGSIAECNTVNISRL